MIDRSHTLPDGSRLRVRLPQPRDRAGLAALHGRVGLQLPAFEVARVLRFDPRSEAVAVATAFLGRQEVVVAYAVQPHGAGEPRLLVEDPAFAPHAAAAVTAALQGHAAGRSAA